MRLEDYRSEFFAYIVNADAQAEIFQRRGYKVETFATEKELLSAAKKTPPHFIVGSLLGLDFLDEVNVLSPEIKVISFKPENPLQAIQEADEAAKKFLSQIENEQIRSEMMIPFSAPQVQEDIYFEKARKFLEDRPKTQEVAIENLVYACSEMIGGKPVIFLKYLPAHSVLLLKRAAGLNEDDVRSVGVPLNFMQPSEAQKMIFDSPDKLQILNEMLKEVFGLLEYAIHPVRMKSQPFGVLILFRPLRTENNKKLLNLYLSATGINLEFLEAEKYIEENKILDFTTGLLNAKAFDKKVTEEISRARRIKQPISLMIFEIDHFQKYKEINGEAMADVIAKSVAQMIGRCSRNTDILARLSEEKFAILCPHSSPKGVAHKAEKLREVIESTPFPCGEKQPLGKLTASFGVSCFPIVTESGEGLVRTAEEALNRIRQSGRNRVCVVEAPRGFEPEFGADDRT